jgi:hypothetical protein
MVTAAMGLLDTVPINPNNNSSSGKNPEAITLAVPIINLHER